ncbi:MAG: 3-oxoacyl-ACP reductase FabG [bacterium]|nr:3-oxoacyl-ACP reductase FabG [bacterium]
MSGAEFSGKTVVVTGGAGGIGGAVALGFAERGAAVAIVDAKGGGEAEGAVAGIEARGGRGMAVRCDARDWEAVREAVAAVTARFGDIHILVNCAGIVRDALLASMAVEDWRAVLETNLGGAFHFMRAVVEGMVPRREGRIINISSVAARRGGRGQSNYAASKAGLEALTRAAALELAPRGITVNAVAPGLVVTDMTATVRGLAGDALRKAIPMRRFAEPGDIVGAVLFLASPAASYITGQVIDVDGGLAASIQF